MLTTIELFAGAGGLALGIEKAGFHTLALNEFDADACATMRINRPYWNVIEGDVAKISSLNLTDFFGLKKGDLDLLSGGAPCQAFSYAGKRLGLEDARGTLFYHYALFLEKLQPKMFLFENVRGLLSHNKGKTYETMTAIFEQAGYTIQKEVLNAWNYGVPQKRERLITIGIRNDLLGKVYFEFPKQHEYKPVLRDILLDCPKSEGSLYSEYKTKIFELVPPGGYWRDIDPVIAKEYMKSCWDVIYKNPEGIILSDGSCVHTIYVEMKNKHNTMNSSAAGKTFIKMQNQLLKDDDCACFLVEAIAKKSQNIKWETTVDGQRVGHKLIRRVSIDKFYELVTGQEDAFFKLCMVLPTIIQKVVDNNGNNLVPHDTVYDELRLAASNVEDKDMIMEIAIFMLGFSTYNGFSKLTKQ